MNANSRSMLFAFFLVAAGCPSTPSDSSVPPIPTNKPAPSKPDLVAKVHPDGAGPSVHPDPFVPSPVPRAGRRLTLDQLEQSISVLFGTDAEGQPIRWARTINGRSVSLLSDGEYGTLLGRPDYLEVTSEERIPSLLYAKFMEEMGRDLCRQVVVSDWAKTDADSRTLVRYAGLAETDGDNVKANLRYLLMRFWGRRGSPELLDALADVFRDASRSADVQAGWRAVCVALVSAPAFHIY